MQSIVKCHICCLEIRGDQWRKHQKKHRREERRTKLRAEEKIAKKFLRAKKKKTPKSQRRAAQQTNPNKLIYAPEWTKTLRHAIRQRDNFVCQECGKTQQENGCRLSVHHIDHNPWNCNLANLISLCKGCHEWVAHKGKHIKRRKQVS